MPTNLQEINAQREKIFARNAELFAQMGDIRESDKRSDDAAYNRMASEYAINAKELERLDGAKKETESRSARMDTRKAKRKLEEDALARFVQASYRGDGYQGLEAWEIEEQRSLQANNDSPYAGKHDFVIPYHPFAPRAEWTSTDAADVIETSTSDQVREVLGDFGGIMQLGAQISTSNGAPLRVPKIDTSTQEGEMLGEAATAATQDLPTPDFTELKAFTFSSKQISIANEVISDTEGVLPALGFALRSATRRLALAMDRQFTIGTGSSAPQGAATYASEGRKNATAGSIVLADLEELYWSIPGPFLSPGRMENLQGGNMARGGPAVAWAMHKDIAKACLTLKDADQRYIFQPGQTSLSGMVYGSSMFGFPVVYCNALPNTIAGAANRKLALFGNFANDWIIRLVDQIVVRSYTDSGTAPTNSTLVLGFARGDSRGVGASANSESFKALTSRA